MEEMEARGWDQLDVLIISGDAYVDHPAFGPVLVARWLEHHGYKVGFIAQPRWDGPADVSRMGRPRLFVGVSAGNLDSMLSKLTAQKKVRSSDDYAPGAKTGLRPNRASVVYANLCRQAFPGLPIVLGGIEASLRRLAHYDYWADSVRRSVLLDAKAHLLVFGMAERAIVEVAQRLNAGEAVERLDGHCRHRVPDRKPRTMGADRPRREPERSRRQVRGAAFVRAGDREQGSVLRNDAPGPARAQPLQRAPPVAAPRRPGGVPASSSKASVHRRAGRDSRVALPTCPASVVPRSGSRIRLRSSVARAVVRGCFGGCSFCSISEHEGRIVQSRSKASVVQEARTLARDRGFDGTLSDVGGPTANMYGLRCKAASIQRACRRPSCLHPRVCPNLVTDHGALLDLLRTLRKEPKLRHVFVNSGIRYDLAERSPAFIRELARHHTSGQLSVAPEHCQPRVLQAMRKPPIASYERFAKVFEQESRRAGKKQFLIPYLIVGHPGATLEDTIALAQYLKRHDMRPRQIQEFIPTPMSVATSMYYTGIDPTTREPVFVERDLRRKRAMKALLMWWDPEHWPLAREALVAAGRQDLIGSLVPAGRGRGGGGKGRGRRR